MCRSWLKASLFEAVDSHLDDSAIGQFFPQAVGGANGETGFSANTISNPWDFVLMLEGAVMFASASVKKLESAGPGILSAPFCVRHVGVGHGSTDPSEEGDARPEMWLPLWETPATAAEVHALMSEGRVRVGRRAARDGLDFARAIGSLGVDRGISAFQRYGFQMRNGRAYFATPLNKIRVERRPEVDLINDIDGWLDRFRSATRGDTVPGSLASVSRRLQTAVFKLCEFGQRSHVEEVLVALGACERALAKRHQWATDSYVRPLSGLSQRWLEEADDGSREFRMAAALASVHGYYPSDASRDELLPLRAHLEPVRTYRGGRAGWREESSPDVVWQPGDPIEAMNRMMARRLVRASQGQVGGWPDRGKIHVSLSDVAHFIEGRLDVRRIVDLAWGLVGIDWTGMDPRYPDTHGTLRPGALFALMKLCHVSDLPDIESTPVEPRIHRYASSGDGLRASRTAARRLRGSSLVPKVDSVPLQGPRVRRAAAALLFPLRATRELMNIAVQPLEI